MFYGPSTAFHYRPTKSDARPSPRYTGPRIFPCQICQEYLVSLTSPRSGRRSVVLLSTYAQHPSLIYQFHLYGPPHYHPPSSK